MSTAEIAKAAQTLSNLRNRLNVAATRATHGQLCVEPAATRKALDDLIEEVDHVYDALRPFAFYTDVGVERLLGLSVAMSYARGGDVTSAGAALVAMFDGAEGKAA